MTEEGGRTKREEGCSGSVKRLISPPQESHNPKRPRTANPQRTALSPTGGNPKVTRPVIGPVKTPHFSSDQSEGHSRGTEVVFNDNKNKMKSPKSVSCHSFGEQRKHQEERDENEKDSGFTLITAQKATASGNPPTRLDKDTHTLSAQPSAQTITPVTQRSAEEGEIDLNEKGATRAAVNRDGDKATSSDQERAGGTLTHFDCRLLHVLYRIVIIYPKTACCSMFKYNTVFTATRRELGKDKI